MHEAIIQLIAIALTNWEEYDVWCLSKGFNPLEIPSRRFINSIWAWLTENMERDQRNTLIDALTRTGYSQPKQRQIKAVAEDLQVAYDPNSKWRAPEGWTPPGWLNEEEAYNNATTFINAQREYQ